MVKFLKILCVVFVAFIVSATTAHAAVPANFQTEQIVTSGLNGPSGFEIAPDGRIFVLERTGKIKVIKNGVLLAQPFADLPSIASGDRGLIGIAFDPAFGIDNHYVYFYYTGLDKLNRLVRFDASEDVGQNGPYLLYQTNSPSEELHVGGSIRFGPDGKLYFAVGDNGYPPNAQNLSNPHGKILRINKDGSIPLDNPFYGQPGALPEIWAYGMRNPWRFQFDSATGRLYGGDVGDYTWEEANLIQKGKNYGWPTFEGYCNTLCGTSVTPLFAYNHAGNSAAITGGPVYRGTMFPQQYRGSFFFGDYAVGFIKYMTLDENGYSTGVYDFDLNAGSVVDLKVAPDGSMYYITYWPGRLYRISYTTGNHNPTANATADNLKGVEPHTVHFSSAGTVDPDNDPLTYLWNFGDGTTSTQANPTKIYYAKGTYAVELTVSDGTNISHAVPVVIQVGVPPTINIGEPTDNSTYKAGDTIHYTVSSLDGAGFDINDSNLSTEILLHHNTHIHPFLGPIIGRQGTFTIPTTGEASADTWFEIKATATDENGLATTKSVFIRPVKSNFTLQTVPAGLSVNLDGVPHATPGTIEGVVGFKRELNAPAVQTLNGKQYQFQNWSDNGSQKHFITTQAADQTYTANFVELAPFTGEYFNNPTLAGNPALVRQDSEINFNWTDGSPAPQIANENFSVRWTRAQYFNAGKYKFTTTSDDGVRLYIDNQLIIDEWHGGNNSYNTTQTLTSGTHTIRMEYMEQFGMANARLEWDLTPDQPVVVNDFKAEYFNNRTLNGAPALTREDSTIDFDWGNGSPAQGINNDNFSARFTKTENLSAGTYDFTVTGDDGVRLYVDNELVLDRWVDQGPTTYHVTKLLTNGNHTIRFEYYENGGGAVAKMNYVKTTDAPAENTFIGEYFANRALTGAPIFTRNDTVINFDWAAGSPDATVPNDNFSARWTKTDTFEAATYEFTVTADDGVRVKVDGELILDKWINQAPTTYKVNKTLTAGSHTLVVEYYENGGGAVAKVNYAKTDTTPVITGYMGEYYNNKTLNGPVTLTRNDAAVDFDWGGGSPDALINANDFSARWTKTDTFEAATYEFTVTADDGVRLKVDGETIIDQWVDQSPTTYKVQKALTAGNHTIVMEYFETGGGAVAKMNYEKVVVTTPPSTGYLAKFWNLPNPMTAPAIPATAPTVTREDGAIDFTWNEGTSPAPQINNNGFVAQWIKTQTFEAGDYTFTTISDDGVRVYLDDQLVIDQWNDHGTTTHTAVRNMTAGNHIIRVEYYEGYWNAQIKFTFEKVAQAPAPSETFTSEFFNTTDLSGPVVLNRQDAAINFNWGDGSPDPLVNLNQFSARFTKQQQFTAGNHTFSVTADDGVRVYIDNQLVINQWIDQPATTYQATVNLTEGNHTIRIEYYENYGGAQLVFQEL